MASLKQEMRQKYEMHSSMAFYDNNSGFEEGLLEKIVNLAFASLIPYSSRKWKITAVKSPVLLQRLSKATDDKRIVECAILLVICEDSGASANMCDMEGMPVLKCPAADCGSMCSKSQSMDLELLSLSIGYAAKYYCIDHFVLKSFDVEKVAREVPLNRLKPAAFIGLGFFRGDPPAALRLPARNLYLDIVRVI